MSDGNIARGTISGGSSSAIVEGSTVISPIGNIALNTIDIQNLSVELRDLINSKIGAFSSLDGAIIVKSTVLGGADQPVKTVNGVQIPDTMSKGQIGKATVTGTEGSSVVVEGEDFTGNIAKNTISYKNIALKTIRGGASGNIALGTIEGGTNSSGVPTGNIKASTITGGRVPTDVS